MFSRSKRNQMSNCQNLPRRSVSEVIWRGILPPKIWAQIALNRNWSFLKWTLKAHHDVNPTPNRVLSSLWFNLVNFVTIIMSWFKKDDHTPWSIWQKYEEHWGRNGETRKEIRLSVSGSRTLACISMGERKNTLWERERLAHCHDGSTRNPKGECKNTASASFHSSSCRQLYKSS